MSRLIDADRLKERDFGEYGYEMRYEIDRQPTVQAISLDKIKRAREEIEGINEVVHDGINHYYKDCAETKKEVLEILAKLIESEDK